MSGLRRMQFVATPEKNKALVRHSPTMFAAMATLLVALVATWSAAASAQPRATADEVKAAFLYHFTTFVEWPESRRRESPLVIAVAGAPAVAEELRAIAGSRKERRISVVEPKTPAQSARAHLLYIGSAESARLERWVGAAASLPVLVVSEAADALERGSMINFVTTDRVQFEVSLETAGAAGLRLSSRLLSVAIRVKKGEHDALGILLARAVRGLSTG